MTADTYPYVVALGPAPGVAAEAVPIAYAGFWRRVVAFLIDYAIIHAVIVSLYVAAALAAPSLALLVDAKQMGLPTTARELSSSPPVTKREGTESITVSSRIVETKVLDRIVYVHRITTTRTVSVTEQDGIAKTTRWTSTSHVRLDPETKAVYTNQWNINFFYFIPGLLYMVLIEASRMQGTVGKLAMNIRVIDEQGNRMTIVRALVRNLLKCLSAVILLIGFMMAGWTRKKQTLHDMMARAVVEVRPA